jgi:disulfide bond formation protein DsbB
MSRRKKDPYRWYMLSVWLIGTIGAFYYAHEWELDSSPQTAKEMAAVKEQFGNLNPEFSWVRVAIYSVFGSFVVYLVVRFFTQLIKKVTQK